MADSECKERIAIRRELEHICSTGRPKNYLDFYGNQPRVNQALWLLIPRVSREPREKWVQLLSFLEFYEPVCGTEWKMTSPEFLEDAARIYRDDSSLPRADMDKLCSIVSKIGAVSDSDSDVEIVHWIDSDDDGTN